MQPLVTLTPPPPLVARLRAHLDRLEELLPAGQAARWTLPPRIKAEAVRTSGTSGVPDPTADLALDAERLALSGATARTERVLAYMEAALAACEVDLSKALRPYNAD